MSTGILQAVNELKKDQNDGVNVGVNENTILDLITLKPAITAKEIALQLKMSIWQTERYLASLKDKGLIIRIGADKNGACKIIES